MTFECMYICMYVNCFVQIPKIYMYVFIIIHIIIIIMYNYFVLKSLTSVLICLQNANLNLNFKKRFLLSITLHQFLYSIRLKLSNRVPIPQSESFVCKNLFHLEFTFTKYQLRLIVTLKGNSSTIVAMVYCNE